MELLSNKVFAVVQRRLIGRDARGNKVELMSSLQFSVSSVDAPNAITSAKEAVLNMNRLSPTIQRVDEPEQIIARMVDMVKPVADPWIQLLENLKIFTQLVDKMADVGPVNTSGFDGLNQLLIGESVC